MSVAELDQPLTLAWEPENIGPEKDRGMIRETLPTLYRRAIREHLRRWETQRSESSLAELRRLSRETEAPEDALITIYEVGLCLDDLGHRTRPRKLLEKLANEKQYPEAVNTLAVELYSNPMEPAAGFETFLQKHNGNLWMLETLARLAPSDIDKEQFLRGVMDNHPQSAHLRQLVNVSKMESEAKLATDPADLESLFRTNEPRVLRAVATNPNTPAGILQKLTEVKSINLAREIRQQARHNLSQKNS